MTLYIKKLFSVFAVLAFHFACTSLSYAQVTDLGIRFTTDLNASLSSVKVGSYFAVTGGIALENNSSTIPGGEIVTATIEILDPDGIIIDSHSESWNGFPQPGRSGSFDNDPTTAEQVFLQIPWSEAKKWNSRARWQLVAKVTGAALESNLGNNQIIHSFEVEIPNLEVSSVSPVGASLRPDTDLVLNAVVRNNSTVTTQNGVFFPLEARLLRGTFNSSAGPQAGDIVDTERIILPFTNEGIEPSIRANESISTNLPPLRIPPGAEGNYTVQVIVDPTDLQPLGSVIYESNETADNHIFYNFAVFNDTPNLQIDADSFTGEVGTFRGLDPVRIAFVVRNDSDFEIEPADNFTARVALSLNSTFDDRDFILREFDLSGDALGSNLLPNETIHLDWIQQMPDGFEGDYYLLVNIAETGQTFLLQNTPSISLKSKHKSDTRLISFEQNNGTPASPNSPREQPTTSRDGSWVAYTQLDTNSIRQVYLARAGTRPREDSQEILISRSFFSPANGGNNHSLAPKISADGTTLVFHSSASDLVPADENGVEDIFVYSIISEKLTRFANSDGVESNGASFYPNLNEDGSKIVFESFADNLTTNFIANGFRQIFLWDRYSGVSENLTYGNGDSHNPSISGNGKRIVFASDASNLPTLIPDLNGFRDVFLFDVDTNETSILSLTQMGLPAMGGSSDQAQISGNGDYVVFRSEATNILRQGGITKVLVERGGAGYSGNIKVEVVDRDGFGSGAVLEIKNDGLDPYGQILKEGIEIISPGANYVSPEITIIPDPTFPAPSQVADVEPFLVNPEGEIYRAEVMNPAATLIRVTESPFGAGGDMASREPSISEDGKVIVFSTKSSNLLDFNVTREDKKVFYNRPVRQAQASALIVGGIGEIEVQNGGSGYQNGFLIIDDYSGLGSGAKASYEVDAFGRISSITVIDSGSNYNLDTTIIGIDSPRGGTGFEAGTIRFVKENGRGQNRTGGGVVHHIEMTDHGMGYQFDNNTGGLEIISIEGDGVDANLDGFPDAKVDPDKVHIDPQTGGIYLEQVYSVRLLSTDSLIGATFSISDANKSLLINFTKKYDATIPNSIPINNRNLTVIRNEITDMIRDTWNTSDIPDNLFYGPQIDKNATGGNSFELSALSGKVECSNPSSIEVIAESNMLFSGSGFTRATPVIAAPPLIYGYSEVHSTISSIDFDNGRKGINTLVDDETDDIYLFEEIASGRYKKERVSRSSSGQPVNYLATALSAIPSNRFPAVSGNGRHIYFSSDAGGMSGLVFDGSNQQPLDINNGRDIYHVDRIKPVVPDTTISVNLLFPTATLSHSFAGNRQMPIIVQVDYAGMDLGGVDLYVNSERVGSLFEFLPELATNRYTGLYTTPVKGELTIQAVAVNQSGNQLGGSEKSLVTIKQSDGTFPPDVFIQSATYNSATNTSRLPLSVTGTDEDGFISAVQYYIDGIPYGNAILNSSDSFNSQPNFPTILEFNNTGVNSVFAIGRDNSGNYVSSNIFNIPVTQGTTSPDISMVGGLHSLDLGEEQIVIETNNSEIINIRILNTHQDNNPVIPSVGSNFVTPPKVQIFGSGSGAKIRAVIDQNISSGNYGKVINFEVDHSGSGYDQDTKIRLVPEVNAVGFGTPAEIRLGFIDDGNGTTIPDRIFLRTGADQSPIVGSGYVNSPRLRLLPNGSIIGREFLRLAQTPSGSYGVDPSLFPIPVPTREPIGAFLEGGFTQSALMFEFSISEPEKIENLTLMVDGEAVETKGETPFTFSWVPETAKEYQIYAVAQDFSGNIIMTELNYVSVGYFKGGGVEASFNMAQNITLPTNASIFLNGTASSEYGIAEVEFYREGKSLGKVLAEDGQKKFFKEVSLDGFPQGTFDISMIARDKAGNEASSFSPSRTNIPARQNLRLTVVASSQDSAKNSLQLLYPNSSHAVKFSTQSTIPVIVDFNQTISTGEVNYARVLLDGNPILGVMNQHEVPDPTNPQLNDYITHRYTTSIDPRFTSLGKHILQAVLYSAETNNPIAQTDFIEIEITDYAQLSPTATLQEIPEDFRHITDTSSVVFSVNAEDLDASIKSVQYYVNGVAHGALIPRVSLVSEDKSKYLLYFEPKSTGSHSIHAVATDTSGNNVATFVESILVTDGTTPSTVGFDTNFVNQEIHFTDLDVNDFNESNKGGIEYIRGFSINQKYTAEPDLRIRGAGSGAKINAKLDENGTLKTIIVESEGRGYDQNSSLIIIPSRRVVREGTPARVTTTWMDYSPGGPPSEVSETIAMQVIQQQELQLRLNEDRLMNANATNPFGFTFFSGLPFSYFITEDWETTFSLERSFDGEIMNGEGYVVSPRFDPPIVIDVDGGRAYIDRLTLSEPENGTSSVEDFTFVKPGAFAKARLTGGFTRAPLYIQALPGERYDNIESVSMMVNGVIDDENRLSKHPFNFTWIARDPEDYILSFVVKDFDGNIYTTPSQTLSVKEYYGSGIGSRFHGAIDNEIQSGSEAVYSVEASSEFGVSAVEFYLDGISIGYGSHVGSGVYNKLVTFENLTQGVHTISYVARDFKGNESGTFDKRSTNLLEFKNKEITMITSSEQDPPKSFIYPKDSLPGEISYRFWRGQKEVIILVEAEADLDGFIEEIFVYSNGEMLQMSDGNFSLKPSQAMITASQNLYPFKYIPDKLGVFELKAMVKDNFGTQKFSENSIFVEVLANNALPPQVSMVFPPDGLGITSTSTIRFEANATDPDGTMESVQFYVNGLKHGPEIPFDRSYSEYNFPYGVNWTPGKRGTYTIHAVGKDNDGNEVLSDYSVVNVANGDSLVPNIDFKKLNSNYLPGQIIFLSADVSDEANGSNNGQGYIEEVVFYANGHVLDSLTEAPYFTRWSPEINGLYEVYISAIDNEGNVATSNVQVVSVLEPNALNQTPQISIIFPPDEISLTSTSTIRFEANASDPDGSVQSVQYYINGEKYGNPIFFDKSYSEYIYPYGINWTPGEKGSYTIHAVARDNDGNEIVSDFRMANVATGDDLVPTVIVQDLNDQYLPDQTVFLSANVSDLSIGSKGSTGIVEEVVFYANGFIIDTLSEYPYFTRWTPEDNGVYEVYAIARDNEGNFGISRVQTVEIVKEILTNQTPTLGSLNPVVSGSVIKIETQPLRRSAEGNGNTNNTTVITGLSTQFLNQLGEGQKIRFSDGMSHTEVYEIYKINSDDELILTTEFSAKDFSLVSNWSRLEIVPIYRAGSWISLNLRPEVEDTNFQNVDFYVDGTLMSQDDTWPFSGIFIPPEEGNYTLSLISVNANGNQNIHSERIEVLPKIGLLPDGSTNIHPNLTRAGATTIGSELIMNALYDDLDDGMSRVEFYLNGELSFVDREKPFSFKFKPKTDDTILSTDRAWEVTAVGIDKAGNRISLVQNGFVQSSVVLPSAEVKSPSNNEEFADGQAIKIRIDVKGSNLENLHGRSSADPDPNLSLMPRMMNVLANGSIVGVAVENSWGSGIFLADWICDLDFAGPSGEVEIMGSIVMVDEIVDGLNFTPSVISNIAKIKIKEPNVGGDAKAAVNQVYLDLLGENPSEQEVNLAVTQEIGDNEQYLFENDDFLKWAAHLTDREIFQNMVDAIAGFKIMTGSYPDYLKIREIMETYSAIPNYGQDGSLDVDGDGFSLRQENLFLTSDQDATDFPNSAFSMGSFVDDILSSSDFTDIHGEVPPLTPPASNQDRFTNYEKNRRDFVRLIYQNKYRTNPTIQQEVQGSYRISVFDPNSKEAQQDQRLMMMQQMSMYSNFGYGGVGGGVGGGGGGAGNINPFASLFGNTNTQNPQQAAPTFRNGEPAVLFVVNMIAEETINNLDMIWGAPSKRDYYETAALIASFWQDNLEILSDEIISDFHGQDKEVIISQLMKDPRYYERFGGFSITRNAEKVNTAPGWKWLYWLGHFNDKNFPWIYHQGLGWLYVYGPSDEQTWFYLPNKGWFGTTKDIWSEMSESSQYLWLYDQQNLKWIAYYLQQPEKQLFWDPQIQSYSELD